ncbi:hypothetical protein LCGC14_0458240 [marine sediment metagenome]|uniref:3-keto-disaccharide hydrolase domain-containing protein n=1 Tax=marine sediment metagenome TaxID=412755 RepID=A0A0F9V2S9_9ZZZZ
MAIGLPVAYPADGLIEQKTGRGFRRDLWIPSSFDYTITEDDFSGDQLKAEYPAAVTSTGTRTFTEHNVGAYLELKSGASTGNYAGTGYGMNWSGDRGFLFEAIVKLPSDIATFKFECGISDADGDAGAVNQKATSTTHNADDYAVFIFDTTHNTSLDFFTRLDAGTVQKTEAVRTIAASGVLRFAIRVNGDDVQAWVNGQKVAEHALGVQGGDGVTPWFFCQARTNSERILQVHKWRMTANAYD